MVFKPRVIFPYLQILAICELAGAPVGLGDEMLHLEIVHVHRLADFLDVPVLLEEQAVDVCLRLVKERLGLVFEYPLIFRQMRA